MPTWAELTTFVSTTLGVFSDGVLLGIVVLAAGAVVGVLIRSGKR